MPFKTTNAPIIPTESIIFCDSDIELCRKAYSHVVNNRPKKAIAILKIMSEKYPDNQIIYTHLSAAYMNDGQEQLAFEITNKIYKKYPKYLYVMINLSHIYLDRGETDKVGEIFEDKFELEEVFPNRDIFNDHEIEMFYLLMGRYHAMVGNLDRARHLRDYLQHFYPDGTAFKWVDEFITNWEFVYSKQNNSDSIN